MPMKIKKMKTIDLSCVSQSSTAICSSIDKCSMIKNSTKSLKTLNSYLGDHYKTLTNNIRSSSNPYSSPLNCISELPFNPRPCSFSSVNHVDVVPRRRSSADVMDIKRYMDKHKSSNNDSTRYLLGESKFLDSLSETATKTRNDIILRTPVFGSQGRRSTSGIETRHRFGLGRDGEEEKIKKHFSLIDVGDEKNNNNNKQRNNAGETYCNGVSQKHSGNHSSAQKHPPHQVVVLRVSLHCKGCEGKLRKHLSKIEGVTSFSIDMETKKVTVVGNVTPLLLLTSISKVKYAQFWPSQTTNSSSSSSSSSTVDFFS